MRLHQGPESLLCSGRMLRSLKSRLALLAAGALLILVAAFCGRNLLLGLPRLGQVTETGSNLQVRAACAERPWQQMAGEGDSNRFTFFQQVLLISIEPRHVPLFMSYQRLDKLKEITTFEEVGSFDDRGIAMYKREGVYELDRGKYRPCFEARPDRRYFILGLGKSTGAAGAQSSTGLRVLDFRALELDTD